MTDVFTDWKPGDPPLKGGVIAATLRYLRGRIDALYAQGLQAEGVADAVVAADRRSFHLVSTTGRALSDIPLAAAPLNERPEGWLVGTVYASGDWFYYPLTRSSYVARVAHQATTFEGDLAAGRLAYIARGGKDANQRYAGVYSADMSYLIGDIVTVNEAATLAYQAIDAVPAGPGNVPGTTYRWQILTIQGVNDFRERWRGPVATGDVVLGHVPLRFLFIPSGAPGSIARMSPAPTAAVTFSLRVNGSEIGTISFAAGATAGVWATTGAFVAAGSLVEVVAKGPAANCASLIIVGVGG
ncbi:hypothetical protein ASF49_08055 [Methylobacterium sp. Leaf104]|uniref:hypothetical protein n=1 Tax=Methylobacterium TaxID=407 RepID=UPI0006FB52AA|nr:MULTISPECIES: hypothetical protein [Methylobacterium]KQP33810.1 hypothetical protein ASF49_08055 [Methylobacterium sp. Leaf104]MCI9879622.1 hypothetical protein [Methylobacterium goesingense]